MPEKLIEEVLWAARERINDLKKDRRFLYIILFKNHGEAAGATLEHPHSQLLALPVIPKRVKEEVDAARLFYDLKERCIFCDIIRQETAVGTRLVTETDRFTVLAPYAPRFPFETWILPKQHESAFENSSSAHYEGLARALKNILGRMNQALESPAYNLVIHTSPVMESTNDYYHWHIELMPKLTKVAGFEWGTGFYLNPTPPEEAAAVLRDVISLS